METYIKRAEDLEAVNVNFMPPLLEAILGDYNRNVPAARDAEVLNVMATITAKLGVSRRILCRASVLTGRSSATVDTSSASGFGRSLRANPEHDKPRLRGVPRTSCRFLQVAKSDKS